MVSYSANGLPGGSGGGDGGGDANTSNSLHQWRTDRFPNDTVSLRMLAMLSLKMNFGLKKELHECNNKITAQCW